VISTGSTGRNAYGGAVTAYDWDELRGLSLARQFPDGAGRDEAAVAEAVRLTGPIQSQTARSPYVGLGARLPGVTHEAITAAYESCGIVRGSNIRGTVHTATPDQHTLLDATTRVAQRGTWKRYLSLDHTPLEEVWSGVEQFAHDEWRTAEELREHLRSWLESRDEAGAAEWLDGQFGRYLAFGHGGLIRRPLRGAWSGQGAAGYRTASAVLPDRVAPEDPLLELARLHLASYGPASRYDLAWWSGLGLRRVDDLMSRLDLEWRDGPDGRAYADLPDAPAARDLPGVRLLPEFDAVLCGYDPKARDRFVAPADNEVLWHRANGLMLAPVLVDGRIGGHWRLEGSGRQKSLAVSCFPGARRPRKAELDEPVAALSTALGATISSVTVAPR
jgi:Winged helix DNA-binding domain